MNPKERHRARGMIIQALYEKDISNNENQQIIAGFLIDNPTLKFDRSYFQTSFITISASLSELDILYGKYLDRAFSALDPVSKAILRLGSFELKHQLEIPHKVVINEAIELAKNYGAKDSHKFINGILDKLAKEIRITEI